MSPPRFPGSRIRSLIWPYALLDPRKDGYVHVTTWSLIITGAFVLFLLLIVLVANHPLPARTAGAVSPFGGHWSPANQNEPVGSAAPDVIESIPAGADAVVQEEPL